VADWMIVLVWCYAGLLLYATHMALSMTDERHRADAYRVLRLLWGTGGLLGIANTLTALPSALP
jgi:hypothetical protein